METYDSWYLCAWYHTILVVASSNHFLCLLYVHNKKISGLMEISSSFIPSICDRTLGSILFILLFASWVSCPPPMSFQQKAFSIARKMRLNIYSNLSLNGFSVSLQVWFGFGENYLVLALNESYLSESTHKSNVTFDFLSVWSSLGSFWSRPLFVASRHCHLWFFQLCFNLSIQTRASLQLLVIA